MPNQTNIHSTAIVDPKANLGVDVSIGPYCIVGRDVSIGDGTQLISHVVVSGKVSIGSGNLVSSFASIGSRPQDLKYKGEDTEVKIGNRNMIREYCNISLGTEGGGGCTVIGDDNLLMVYTHVAHDCALGNKIVVANSVALAGHVKIEDGAVLGGLSAVHQFCRIGPFAMIAGGAMVAQDVIPFGMVHGDRARLNGLNVVGLRRLGVTSSDLQAIKSMYHMVFDSQLTLEDAISKVEQDIPASQYKSMWLDFIRRSERGLCR